MRSMAFNQAQTVPNGQTEQALDTQEELDSCVGEDVLATSPTTGMGAPLYLFVQSDRQQPTGLKCSVVRRAVGYLVAGHEFSHGPMGISQGGLALGKKALGIYKAQTPRYERYEGVWVAL